MKAFAKIFLLIAIFMLSACISDQSAILRLATTTSTYNSGLLDHILPVFEERYKVRVDVLAVGTGQAIALGEAGDVDLILVHAINLEEIFIEEGHGIERHNVMYNDFVIVGPKNDSAGIRGLQLASNAFQIILNSSSVFVSRGDESGTHYKEQLIWESLGLDQSEFGSWYKSIGQGMGDTLLFAEEVGAYTLSDRGTFLALQDNLPSLEILLGGNRIEENADPLLINPYGIIPVNPAKGNVNSFLSEEFILWLTDIEAQTLIANFGIQNFGQALFYPNSEVWIER
jgi:tungstate transport system substrate-binding protein